MKKILTLLIAFGAFATLHAQSREETRRVILGGSKDNGSYGGRERDVILGGGNNGGQNPTYPNGSYGGDRQYQIDQINREYDAKIYSIRNNPNLSYEEKQRMIRQLERDRQRRINDISRQYNDGYGNDNNRNYKKDNGKHKGWTKGKGNPHKNGGKNWKNN
jgi:hypothetical protein